MKTNPFAVGVVGILIGSSLLAQSLFAIQVYRYEWQVLDASSPTPLGDPFSGYIDFLTPTGGGGPSQLGSNPSETGYRGIFDTQFAVFYDVQFTSWPSSDPNQPFLPSVTYSLATDPHGYVLVGFFWDEIKVSDLGFSIFFPGPGGLQARFSRYLVRREPSESLPFGRQSTSQTMQMSCTR